MAAYIIIALATATDLQTCESWRHGGRISRPNGTEHIRAKKCRPTNRFKRPAWFLGTCTRVGLHPNSISIAHSFCMAHGRIQQTNTHTDHATWDICSHRPHLWRLRGGLIVPMHLLVITSFQVASINIKKMNVARTRLPRDGFRNWSRFLAVSLQATWVLNPAVGCHYFPPGLQLPSQLLRVLLPIWLLGEPCE